MLDLYIYLARFQLSKVKKRIFLRTQTKLGTEETFIHSSQQQVLQMYHIMFSNRTVAPQTGTTVDIFLKQAEAYTTFKVATFLTTYWFPVLVPIGLVGNTLSFLVMIKPINRKLSTCIYMAGISVNDNLMMFLALHNWLVSAMKVHEFKPLECTFSSCSSFVFTKLNISCSCNDFR